MMSSLSKALRMIKFEHTLFALPFAIGGAVLAANGMPQLLDLMLIVAAAVFARTAAMTFNRIVDRDIDASNPRTQNRELVTKELDLAWAWRFFTLNLFGFILIAFLIAPICGWLSFPVVIVLCGYSLLKRFTLLCHFGLGLALACAPAGAWLAVSKSFLPGWELPLWIGGGVILWVAGFDLLYAIQDIEHDQSNGLNSIPARLGPHRTRLLAFILHIGAVALWWQFGQQAKLGVMYMAALGGVALLLLIEHLLLFGGKHDRIPIAFFTVNAWVGPVWLGGLFLSLPTELSILTE